MSGRCVFLVLALTSGCAGPAQSLNQRGITLFQSGDYQAALQQFQMAALNYPSDPDVYYNLGMTHHRLRQSVQAEHCYQMCLGFDPEHSKAHHALVVLLLEQGRQQEALAHANDWVMKSPANPDPLVELAWLERETGQPDQARETLRNVLVLDPYHARALVELASIYQADDRADRALTLYDRALRANPGNVELARQVAELRQTGDRQSSAMARMPSELQTAGDLRSPVRR